MITMNTDRLVESYLKALEAELTDLPGNRRLEILEEVREHIAEAGAGLTSEAEIRTMLERLGNRVRGKAAIRSDREGGNTDPRDPDNCAVAYPIAGWVLSSVLMWLSTIWTRSDKTIGTIGALAFIPIGAISFSIPSGSDQSPVGSPVVDAPNRGVMEAQALLTVALAVVIPLATAIYLAVRLRSHRQAATV